MRWRHLILGLAMGWLGLPSAAWAILIEIKTPPTNKQVGGYLVSEDDNTLEIREDGKEQPKRYDKTKIKIIHRIETDRLKKLAQNEPKAYYDYAVQLADKELAADPEARYMARRLFLIAAYLDPQQFGHSALLSMIPLASTPAEAQQCRAMAFLLDPKGDASVLIKDAEKPAPMPKANELKDFQMALQYYRTGQIGPATKIAKQAGMDKVFSRVPGMMDQKTFVQRCDDATCTTCNKKGWMRCNVCNGNKIVANEFGRVVACTTCSGKGMLTCTTCGGTGANQTILDNEMQSVLRAELWVTEQLSGGAAAEKKDAGATKWSSILQARQVSRVVPLSLKTIIPNIDPRKCLYRDGKWVVP
jgi:hypothetical protein